MTMPPIISFAWTTPALLAGEKTVTRRLWSPDHARRFRKGDYVRAYDRNPRNGGKQIALIRLTADPSYEPDADAPDSDWAAEGFQWFWNRECLRAMANALDYPIHSEIADRCEWIGFDAWRNGGGRSWVVRFEVVRFLVPAAAQGAAR